VPVRVEVPRIPQLTLALTSTVALKAFVPVMVPIEVPAPVLHTAETPKDVETIVTSAPDEEIVPFVPEVEDTDTLPVANTVVV
jgi:hypothetical protein